MASETALVKYNAARHALQVASSVDEVKDVKDRAEALRLYARQRNDKQMERWFAEIRIRATRKIGELSRALEKDAGGRPSKTLPTIGKSFKAAALKAAGLSTSVARHP